MADVEERAKVQPPAKRRRVNDEDDDDDSVPSPRRASGPTNGTASRDPSPKIKREPADDPESKREPQTVDGESAIVDDARIPRHAPEKPIASGDAPIPRHAPPKTPDEPSVPRHALPPPDAAYQPPSAPTGPPAPPVDYRSPPAPPADSAGRMPGGLAPDVDAVLEKIFLSGLFSRQDVDGRALDFLASVSPPLAMAALDDIQHRDFSTVRNKPAFIMSIFKRVVSSGSAGMPPPAQAPVGGYPPTSVPASALAHLPPTVSDALQRVFASGVCHPSQFDDRAMDILVDLQEADAVRALSEFAEMEPGRVRNPSAFWMGLARKYKGLAARRDSGMGAPYGGGEAYGGAYGRGAPGNSYGPVDQRIQDLISHGALPPNPFDDRAMDALRRLPEQDALSVLSELPEASRVRNMSAYVMGLCKKFASGEARSLVSARAGYPGGGGYDVGGGYAGYAGGAGGYGPPPSGYGGDGGQGGYGPAPPAAYSAPGGDVGGGPPPVPGAGGAPGSNGEVREAVSAMHPTVRERFYGMIDRGLFAESAFDQRAMSALQTMRSEEACAALDELAASDPGRIHNISAYFMGLAKKFNRTSM